MSAPALAQPWRAICALDDILPASGVCADLDGRQVAVFRVDDDLYALDNLDPAGGANVLSRGLVGDLGGELVVASPLYKHHYSLVTGRCLEEPDFAVNTYLVRAVDGTVWLQARARRRARPGRRKLVVVGNGMAGMRTVEELLKLAPSMYDIVVFGREPHANYNRILLSPLLAGEKQLDDIILHPLEWYRDQGVTLHAGDPIVGIDRTRRRVTSQSGLEVTYDRLLLATGSTPVVLPIPGKDLAGVGTFRDLDDVQIMLAAARQHTHALVIGGGLLGLEAAHGLRRRGMDVTVVHKHAHLMERQLDATAAELLKASLERLGLKFKLSATTQALLGDSRVTAARFDDGSELPADLVVMAVGVRPDITLAQLAGLRSERGVRVDDTLLTFDPSIYAVGECVQHRNNTFGLVAPLWEQARVCAAHLAEVGVARFAGALPATQLKVTGIHLFSAGDFRDTPRSESLILRDPKRGVYKRLVLEDDRIRGAVLVGDTADGPWYVELMTEGRAIGALRDKLLFGEAAATAAATAAARADAAARAAAGA